MAARGANHGIDRAFLTAHLLTASIEQAESALAEAIGSWNPKEESEEILFQHVLDAAAKTPLELGGTSCSNPDASDSHLADELRTILKMAPQLRRCFVLRVLVGLPREACTRLLRLHADEVDQRTCAALESLVVHV